MAHPFIPPTETIDRLLQFGAPGAAALRDREGVLSYEQAEEWLVGLAKALAGKGLKPGDRLASWLNKTRLACLLPLAAARAGLIHVPINPVLKRAQVKHILGDSGAAMLIAGAARLGSLGQGDVPPECRIADDRDAEFSFLSNKIALPQADVMPSRRNAEEIACILYTSGSTGRPKGVVLSHRNLWLGAIAVRDYLTLSPEDRTLCVLPLSFDYGQNQLFSAWAAGGSVVPLDYLVPRDIVQAIEIYEISVLAGVPPLWTQLVSAAWPDAAAARLRTITNSGGRLSPSLIAKMRALFPNAALHSMYGLTEAFRSTSLDPALIDRHPEAIGTAIPFAEIMVVRPDGTPAEDDEPGELVHTGPLVAQGYWNDPERTAARFRPAPPGSAFGGIAVWSGDTVARGKDGLLRFIGRRDEMIKTAGNRVSPTEIEEAAIASGVASEAVAWGVSDDALGQAIRLAVAGEAGDETILKAYLKRELPTFMQPSAIDWHQQLPRNANGKLDRAALSKGEQP